MRLVKPHSLSATLDAINEAFFFERSLSASDRERAAKWIAKRQGKAGAYADMFAPVEDYRAEPLTLFTGESRASRAGAAHILGEESCRALILLDVRLAEVEDALARASSGMMKRLGPETLASGIYCCAMCSVAMWRHLAVGGLDDSGRYLKAGLKTLGSRRDRERGWRGFPVHYTLLALSEMGLPAAVAEMRHAAPLCERYLRRGPTSGAYALRRRRLAEKVLARV
jgi:hypothetical protein